MTIKRRRQAPVSPSGLDGHMIKQLEREKIPLIKGKPPMGFGK